MFGAFSPLRRGEVRAAGRQHSADNGNTFDGPGQRSWRRCASERLAGVPKPEQGCELNPGAAGRALLRM